MVINQEQYGIICFEGVNALPLTSNLVNMQLPPHEPAVVRRAVNHFLQVWEFIGLISLKFIDLEFSYSKPTKLQRWYPWFFLVLILLCRIVLWSIVFEGFKFLFMQSVTSIMLPIAGFMLFWLRIMPLTI